MNVTVTLELFQPCEFGAGEADAEIDGGITTVNATPLLETPLTVTTTLPVVAAVGTEVAIDVGVQLIAVAAVPLNAMVLAPCVAPKFVPVMVTGAPISPDVGDRLVIDGGLWTVTVNETPLLDIPETVTTTLPLEAPVGTGATIEVALQLVGVAPTPLKATVLDPCVRPKFAPVIVTDVPTAPEVGDRLVIDGATTTVKLTPLLVLPLTVTVTLPVVAPLGTGT